MVRDGGVGGHYSNLYLCLLVLLCFRAFARLYHRYTSQKLLNRQISSKHMVFCETFESVVYPRSTARKDKDCGDDCSCFTAIKSIASNAYTKYLSVHCSKIQKWTDHDLYLTLDSFGICVWNIFRIFDGNQIHGYVFVHNDSDEINDNSILIIEIEPNKEVEMINISYQKASDDQHFVLWLFQHTFCD